MNNIAVITFLATYLLNIISSSFIPTQIGSDFVVAMQKFFSSPWICLLYSEQTDKDYYELFQFQRKISNLTTTEIAIMSVENYRRNLLRNNTFGFTRPLVVILSADNITRNALKDVTGSLILSKPIWVLLAPNNFDIENYFYNMHIPIYTVFLIASGFENENKTIILQEIYRVNAELNLHKYFYGTWTKGSDVTYPSTFIYRRRRNMTGLVLRATYIEVDPAIKGNPVAATDEFYRGFWQFLEGNMNFQTKEVPCPDGFRGRAEENIGMSNGMIGVLERREADAAIGMMSMTPHRTKVVDFPLPIQSTSYVIFIRQEDSVTISLAGFNVFDRSTWVCIILQMGVLMIAGALCCWTLSLSKPKDYFESVFFVYAALCQKSSPVPIYSWALRCLLLFTYVMMLVIFTAYNSSLISALAVKHTNPFNSLEEFVRDGSYKVAVVKNTASEDIFYRSDISGNLLLKQLSLMLEPIEDCPDNDWNGLLRVCENDHFGLIVPKITISSPLLGTLPCLLVAIPTDVRTGISIAFSKKSPYLDLVNYIIKIGLETGVISYFTNRKTDDSYNLDEAEFFPVQFRDILTFLCVVVAGIISSALLIIFECLWFHKSKVINIFSKKMFQTYRKQFKPKTVIRTVKVKPFPFLK